MPIEQTENTHNSVEAPPEQNVMDEINTARIEQQSAGQPAGGTDSNNGTSSAIGEDGQLDFGNDNIYQSQFSGTSQSMSSESAAPEFENDPVLDYAEKNFEKFDGDGDGRVTSQELQNHARRNGENLTPEERANLAHLRGRQEELQNMNDDDQGDEKGISLKDLDRAQVENVQRQQQEQRGAGGGGSPNGGSSPIQVPGPNDLRTQNPDPSRNQQF